MPTTEPTDPGTDRRRCPVCWTWFTPNSPSNPHPRRYCSGACRIADSRRRREREQTQPLPDTKPDTHPPNTHTAAQRRETNPAATPTRRKETPINPD